MSSSSGSGSLSICNFYSMTFKFLTLFLSCGTSNGICSDLKAPIVGHFNIVLGILLL